MRKSAIVLAVLLLVPALAFAGDGDVRVVGGHDVGQKITVRSGGKTVATLTIFKGDGGTLQYEAQAVRAAYDGATNRTTLSGGVSLKLIRNGKPVMQMVADEAIVEQARQPTQPTPIK